MNIELNGAKYNFHIPSILIAVIESLPDSVPPFTIEDLQNDAESVRKFMRCCLLELKPVMQLELRLYDNEENWVNVIYDEDGTLCQEVGDGREDDQDTWKVDHLLLNPRRLEAPDTTDVQNPKKSWDGKYVGDIKNFPKEQVGFQKDPRPEKVRALLCS